MFVLHSAHIGAPLLLQQQQLVLPLMWRLWGHVAVFAALARPPSIQKTLGCIIPKGFPVPYDPSFCAFIAPKPRYIGTGRDSSSNNSNRMRGSTPLAGGAAAERLQALRKLLQQHHLDALLIEDADAHGSEIPAASFARRSFLSSFDGSSGMALVTAQEALLWTDGRCGQMYQ